MSLPRRYFTTTSSAETTDILRTREAFALKVIDTNDVAGAAVVKENINNITNLEQRVSNIETTLSPNSIGTIAEFSVVFNLSK